jgi:hypothetical protein
MFDAVDLNQLEKKAFRAIHQDGLWDIYIGGVVLSMSVLAYSEADDAFPLPRFLLFLLGLGLSYLVFWGGRKYLTTPRLGQVKFGPRRQQRKRTMVFVLCGIVLLQVLVLAGTLLLWNNPQWAASLGLTGTDRDRERLLVAVVGALFVGPSTALIAYFNDFMRGYYISLLLALAVFALIWFGQPIYLIAAGLLILLPGAVLFIRFLRAHPLPPDEVSHD